MLSLPLIIWLASPLAIHTWTSRIVSTRSNGICNFRPLTVQRRQRCRQCLCSAVGQATNAQEDKNDDASLSEMIPGTYDDFAVAKVYYVPSSFDDLESVFSSDDIQKKNLTPNNMSVPTALMMLDPELYPSQSKARKVCRKGFIAVLRRDQYDGDDASSFINATKALVGDRVYAGDAIARQVRVAPGFYTQTHHAQSNPLLSVVYEDDHFAIVYKPAGYTVFKNYKSKCPSVQAVLPWSLIPPKLGTLEAMRRPLAVHRLDKPTSGLLIATKTRPAMVDLSRQFHDRVIQKTYMAVVNGLVPPPLDEWTESLAKISAEDAFHEVGVDVDPSDQIHPWYKIEHSLQDQQTRVYKNATTIFRVIKQVQSLHARDGCLSLVELKPKTGRYHQLRRHIAWVCERTLVGDSTYDGNAPEAMKFRGQGLFLTSTRVKLEHPFYNTEIGRIVWNTLGDKCASCTRNDTVGQHEVYEDESGRIIVAAEVELPVKFNRLLERANDRFFKFSLADDDTEDDVGKDV
ncbi:hypothetical protein MPSEU_001070200 [Mayamaea pseudoterrestris]|nr:hypothetical protein MPSEU_001070200 [Mayamaea pseudoterrestris]